MPSALKAQTWTKLALSRAKARNTRTGKVGKIVGYSPPNAEVDVFLHYHAIGSLKMPVFDRWPESEVELVKEKGNVEIKDL